MICVLPYKNFEWNNDIWTKDMNMKLEDKGEKGYLFSVDLHIHDHFNNYPLCAENILIQKNDLISWQQENCNESKIKKLCITLKDKTDYYLFH